MKIHLYSVIRNECFILPYFLRHYSQFCERMVIYDDNSNDGSRELLLQCPQVEMRSLPWTGIDDTLAAELFSKIYHEARGIADYVIEVDADEFVYHPNLLKVLEDAKKSEPPAIRCEGWQMLSDQLPSTNGQIYEEIRHGIQDNNLSKWVVFDPAVNAYQQVGRHYCTFDPPVRKCEETGIKLLHFRFLSLEYVKAKHAANASRLTQNNKDRCLGTHNCSGWTGHQSMRWYLESLGRARPCLG